jgi:hypothetical protein
MSHQLSVRCASEKWSGEKILPVFFRKDFLPLFSIRDGAYLFKDVQLVSHGPVLSKFAIHNTINVNSLSLYSVPGRGSSHKLSFMRTRIG